LDDALQIVESTGQRWFAAELNRHKGRLLLGARANNFAIGRGHYGDAQNGRRGGG
jgi:hypothetical protein